MDIVDIMLAKALTPQGKTEAYVAKAEKAAQKAAKAEQDAAAAIATVNAAANDIADAQAAATQLLSNAQETLETAQAAQINIPDTEDIDAEVKKFQVSYSRVLTNAAEYYTNLHYQYPDGTTGVIPSVVALQKKTGTSETAGMTQKAITDALSTKADASTVATKTYVDQQIANIPASSGSGGVSNLGRANAGKMVIVNNDGNITAGLITEADLIETLIAGGGYTARDAVGLEVDYENKSFVRTQQAIGKTMGSDFNSYLMYGGRRRCNVADDGTINAFYGQNGYTEDGSNGQVMVYQPKFYYQRIPITTLTNKVGKIVTRDSIMVSYVAQNGFKVHPLFVTPSGEELDYVLLSAYEGSLFDVSESTYVADTATNVDFTTDKLSSVINVKPITGSSDLSLSRAEQLANNRGDGWHIYNLAAESANQMLEIVEFGSLNGQTSLGKGVSFIANNGNYNQAAITGSTSSLGNASGSAASTIFEVNGTTSEETEDGKVSISYRGVENPWGNIWQMLGGVTIVGNSATNGGVPYICKNYNYSYGAVNDNYESVEFSLPNVNGWISSLGYGNKKYDWVLMPAVCGNDANSALPVGDRGWFDSNLAGVRMVVQGGGWSFEDADGPFYYGCDKEPTNSSYKSYGARLLYIPTKNNIYTTNITKWRQEMNIGG